MSAKSKNQLVTKDCMKEVRAIGCDSQHGVRMDTTAVIHVTLLSCRQCARALPHLISFPSIPACREISRQEYLAKREAKKLEELK